MKLGNRCKECGASIPADSPGGFCAQCMLGLGLKRSGESGAESAENEGLDAEGEGQQLAPSEAPPESKGVVRREKPKGQRGISL